MALLVYKNPSIIIITFWQTFHCCRQQEVELPLLAEPVQVQRIHEAEGDAGGAGYQLGKTEESEEGRELRGRINLHVKKALIVVLILLSIKCPHIF